MTFAARLAGHGAIFRPLDWSSSGDLDLGDIPLRAVQTAETITLPGADDDPVSVQVVVGSQAVTLLLGAGDLVDAGGHAAVGDVQVELSYWHPLEDLSSAPALLVALEGNALVELKTFGMAGVDVFQNGQPLNVAPGHHVTLNFTQLPSLLPMWEGTSPNLYVVDEATGLWTSLGGRAQGVLSLNPDSGVVSAYLPHLSYWNLDGAITPSGGGCVSGVAYNACEPTQGVDNTPVRVWFLSNEEVKDFNGTTDSQGRYCLPTYVSDYEAAYNQQHGESAFVVNYLVTGADITNTSMCNPLPASCRQCSAFYENFNGDGKGDVTTFCNRCQLFVPNDPPSRTPTSTRCRARPPTRTPAARPPPS